MRSSSFRILCCTLAFFLSHASAADFGPISIAVPDGFDGPLSGGKDGALTTAWVKHHVDAEGGTVLQITTYEDEAALKGITYAERADAAATYLTDFVGGVARRRDNFKLGRIERLTLAGLPAARVMWTGSVGSAAGVGVMYCVVVNTTIVTFHTQDTGAQITDAMKTAMAAIESARTR